MNAEDYELLLSTMPPKYKGAQEPKVPPATAVRQLEEICERTGLTWKARQVYLQERGGKWHVTLSIDGFRTVASRSKQYLGQVGPEWAIKTGENEYCWTNVPPEGKPYAARVGVQLRDAKEPTWGVAVFKDYAAGPMWDKFPTTMIAKCAEMLALRKALPADFSGLYGVEEMGQARRKGEAPDPGTDDNGGVALASRPAGPPTIGDTTEAVARDTQPVTMPNQAGADGAAVSQSAPPIRAHVVKAWVSAISKLEGDARDALLKQMAAKVTTEENAAISSALG